MGSRFCPGGFTQIYPGPEGFPTRKTGLLPVRVAMTSQSRVQEPPSTTLYPSTVATPTCTSTPILTSITSEKNKNMYINSFTPANKFIRNQVH